MNPWSRLTKFLHLGIAVTIVAQLVISLVMEFPSTPKETQGIGATFFEFHETIGLVAAALILLHWLWLFRAPDTGFATLFPWSASGRRQVVGELKHALSGEQLSGGPQSGGLVGLVHGLGLLTAAAMALSGTMLLILLPEGGEKPGELAHAIMETHGAIASLMWIYVIAHVAMAYRHHFSGHTTMKDIFKL